MIVIANNCVMLTASDAKYCAINSHKRVGTGHRTKHSGDAAHRQTPAVQPQTVDERVVGQIAEHQTTHCTGDAYYRYKYSRLLRRSDVQTYHSVLKILNRLDMKIFSYWERTFKEDQAYHKCTIVNKGLEIKNISKGTWLNIFA